MNSIYKEVKDNIRNDLGAKIAGCILMAASIVSVFIPELGVTWESAMLPFVVGLYLAFRKTKTDA